MNKKRQTIKDIYEKYSTLNVDWNTYIKVLHVFHEQMCDYLIETGGKVILPKRLGSLQIKKRPTKDTKKVDFHLTKVYGETIYHTNKHSEGYYGTFIWDKNKPQAVFSNKQLYSIEMTRTNKRNLSKAIKEDNAIIKYIEY